MNDIDKAEDRMLDEEDSFDLDDDFNPLLPNIFKGYSRMALCKLLNQVNLLLRINIVLRSALT